MSLENHGKQSAYRIFGKFFIFGTQNNLGLCNIGLLEIKPCGLGSIVEMSGLRIVKYNV